MKVHFGPAGKGALFLLNRYKDSLDIPDYVTSLGLNAFEYQCGHGVNISEEKAKLLGAKAEEKNIQLSLHSPYYISLSSVTEEKRMNSINYIIASAKAAKDMGAKRVVVHSGSLSGNTREVALELAKDTLKKALITMDEMDLGDIHLCPETMGKINQLGDLYEVMELCKLDDRLIPCIDFGHLNARTLGEIKGKEDYKKILDTIENELGSDRLKIFHSHFSRIEYTKGGEKKHLTFEDTQFGPDHEPLLELIAEKDLSPTIICESAGTQDIDSKIMMDFYKSVSEK
jgi:deoxyribonuclease-4